MCSLLYGVFNDDWYYGLYYTNEKIILFIVTSYAICIECINETTSAIYEASDTQITSKTFHSAGVKNNFDYECIKHLERLMELHGLSIQPDKSMEELQSNDIALPILSIASLRVNIKTGKDIKNNINLTNVQNPNAQSFDLNALNANAQSLRLQTETRNKYASPFKKQISQPKEQCMKPMDDDTILAMQGFENIRKMANSLQGK